MYVFCSLILWNIMKSQFRMKTSVVMFFKPLFHQRQKYPYFFQRNSKMPILGTSNQLTMFIVFSDAPTLNVISYIVRRFTYETCCLFYRY